jgi:carbohydrate kinase (thermoresistant glucokinase family)
VIVVMGVSGSGKSTVAALVAAALGCQFREGDDLHPPENVEKMHGGTPLTDADRMPWLRKIAKEIDDWRARGECGVLTCSALKRSYRDIIIGDRHDVVLVYLKGSRELVRTRMIARHEHFMPVALLDSQFATLEEPGPDEHPIVVDIGGRKTGRRRPRNRAPARGPAARSEQARAARRDERVRGPTTAIRAALGIPRVRWGIGSVGGWPAVVR